MPCIRSCSRFFSSFPPVFSSFSLHVNFLFFCEGVVVAMIQIVSSLLLLILLLLFMLPPNLVCIYNAFHFDGFGFAAGVS